MRWVVNRPDVPPDLNVDHLILVRSDAERAEIYRRIDQAAIDPGTTWLLDTAFPEQWPQE